MKAKELRKLLYEVTDNTPVTIKTENLNPLKMYFGIQGVQKVENLTADGKKSVSMRLICK